MPGFTGSFCPEFSTSSFDKGRTVTPRYYIPNSVSWTPSSSLSGSPWTMEFFFLCTEINSTLSICSCSLGEYYWNIGKVENQFWCQLSLNGDQQNNTGSIGDWIIEYVGTGTNTISKNTWYHAALSFSGTGYNFFFNGVKVASYVSTIDLSTSLNYVRFNGIRYENADTMFMNYYTTTSSLYISNFRISKIPRYIGFSYTVPVPPYTLDSNTYWLQTFSQNPTVSSSDIMCTGANTTAVANSVIGSTTSNLSGCYSTSISTLPVGSYILNTVITNSNYNLLYSPILRLTISSALNLGNVIINNFTSNLNANVGNTFSTISFSGQVIVVSSNITPLSLVDVVIYDGTSALGNVASNATGYFNLTTSPLNWGTHIINPQISNLNYTQIENSNITVTINKVNASITNWSSNATSNISSYGNSIIVSGNVVTTSLIGLGNILVTITDNILSTANIISNVTTNLNGTFSLITSSLSPGNHILNAAFTDNYYTQTTTNNIPLYVSSNLSNVSVKSFALSYVNTGISRPVDTAFTTDGLIFSGQVIYDANSQVISGTTIGVYRDTSQIGTATTNNLGTFEYIVNSMAYGTYSMSSQVIDSRFVQLKGTTSLPLSIGLSPVSTINFTSNISGNSFIYTQSVLFSGNIILEPSYNNSQIINVSNLTVAIVDNSTIIGTSTTNATGYFSLIYPYLSVGSHTISVSIVDSTNIYYMYNSSNIKSNVATQTVYLWDFGTSNVISGNTEVVTVSGQLFCNSFSYSGLTDAAIESILSREIPVNGVVQVDDFLLEMSYGNQPIEIYSDSVQIGTTGTDYLGNFSYQTKSLRAGIHKISIKLVNTNYTLSNTSIYSNVTVLGAPVLTGIPSIDAVVNVTSISYSVTNSGSTAIYSISPTLPNGLSFSNSSGSISGIPLSVLTTTNYTIQGVNSLGSDTLSLSLQVIPVNGADSVVGVLYQSFVYNLANPSGLGLDFTISPSLPTGLTLNTTTGNITGIPTSGYIGPSSYTFTILTSTLLTFTKTISIMMFSENATTKPSLIKLKKYFILPKGKSGNLSVVTNSGGTGYYTISPAIPSGISIQPFTGLISGTPTGRAALAPYIISCTNSAGSSNVTINFTFPNIINTINAISVSSIISSLENGDEIIRVNESGNNQYLTTLSKETSGSLTVNNQSIAVSNTDSDYTYSIGLEDNTLNTSTTYYSQFYIEAFDSSLSNVTDFSTQPLTMSITLDTYQGTVVSIMKYNTTIGAYEDTGVTATYVTGTSYEYSFTLESI